jgi:malate dehydrogenase (oxaloacetate-decarboxylating)
VVLAWLINALKLADKSFDTIKIVISGAWAAGTAIANLLYEYGATNIIVLDSQWAINSKRNDLNKYKLQISKYNLNDEFGDLYDVIKWADVFVWVSQPDLLKADGIKTMASKPIVFAMANPNPEVIPQEAKAWNVFIYATGRSDYPNQINNLLVFPWIFKWALKYRKTEITTAHKLKAAEILAGLVTNPSVINIIPSPLEKWIADKIAESMRNI